MNGKRLRVALAILALALVGGVLAGTLAGAAGEDLTQGSSSEAQDAGAPATIAVDSEADGVDANPGDGVCADATGACTLRAAIQEAGSGDTVEVPIGTYTLAPGLGELTIDKDMTLTGEGSGDTILQAATQSDVANSRVLSVSDGNVTVSGVTIRHGRATDPTGGGGIRNSGTLTLVDSTVSGNNCTRERFCPGGGILNEGTLTLISSIVSGNTVKLGSIGGGGIYNDNGTLTLRDSTVTRNTAGSGGGITSFGTLTIMNSKVSGNVANDRGGNGGGIYGGGTSAVTVTNSTVSDNKATASDGGGIFNDVSVTLTITNGTISGNTSGSNGGGIRNFGTLTITNSTVAGNGHVGIYNSRFEESGTVELINTIIADSPGGDCFGPGIASLGHNLDSDSSCALSATDDLSNRDPRLDLLADNGGPTKTHALLPDSSAIDKGDDDACPGTDQRGVERPQGTHCDIGAFEYEPPPLTVNSFNDVDDGTCDAAHCSLREAINAANRNAGLDTIVFNIPGPGSHAIQPTSALPTITDPVVIDGYTQPGASPNTNGPGLGLNSVLMIELDGTIAGTGVHGLRLNSSGSTVQGLVINRFFEGVSISTSGATGNMVLGNFIGTDVSGAVDLGNTLHGVLILHPASNNAIGGTTPDARNLISGNDLRGVGIFGTAAVAPPIGTNLASGNVVQGNLIGVQADGTSPLGNASRGINIGSFASNNTIGGTASGAGNVIAFNPQGVVIFEGTGNAILSNSTFSNGGLGIDLAPIGVTPNDSGDADTGANELQNFPVLTSAIGGGGTVIEGTLNSTPNTEFRVELFSNSACDPSGHGEGEAFIGAISVTTDGNGNVSFMANSEGGAVPSGHFITATATDPGGNTSEFSQCIQVSVPAEPHSVMGTVVLEGMPNPITGAVVTFSANSTVVDQATSDPVHGRFEQILPEGVYDVSVEKDGFLAATMTDLEVDRDIALEVLLLAGDLDGDGVIDVTDLMIPAKNQGKTESPLSIGHSIAREELPRMVLALSDVQPLFPSLEIDRGDTGFHDNEASAEETIDPEDTAEDLAALGRLDGYSIVFRDPEGTFENPERLFSVESIVDLMDSQASALAYLRSQAESDRRLVGTEILDGIVFEAFEETPAPDIGMEADAGRLVLRFVDSDLIAVITFAAWIRGPVLAVVLTIAFDEDDRSAVVELLARRMDLRIDAVLGPGG